jgi:hypothetical protein
VLANVNPDGAHYSMYDFASQRRNMVNYCPTANFDPTDGNRWGVDLNRNNGEYSLFDGYFGASTSCTSDAGNVTQQTVGYRLLDATNVNGDVGGAVPATLSLTLGAQATFGGLHSGRGARLLGVDDGECDLAGR